MSLKVKYLKCKILEPIKKHPNARKLLLLLPNLLGCLDYFNLNGFLADKWCNFGIFFPKHNILFKPAGEFCGSGSYQIKFALQKQEI